MGTVSRCLNGFDNVSPRNAEKVKEAVKVLGYRQCASARALVARRNGSSIRTGNIGVFFPRSSSNWADHPVMLSYVMGIEKACVEHKAHMLLEFATSDGHDLPRFLEERKVDGLLIKENITPPPKWLMELSERLPVVGMGMSEPSLAIPQVAADDHAAGMQVSQYLWDRGHRRIAFIASLSDNRMFLRRRQGVEEFLAIRGAYDSRLMVCPLKVEESPVQPELSPPDMLSQLQGIWDVPVNERPTALIAANDWIAAGCYNAMEHMGIRPGLDLSVVSFDNMTSLCTSLKPNLSSYSVPLPQIAYSAARILFDWISAPDRYVSRGVQLVAGQLNERHSVVDLNA